MRKRSNCSRGGRGACRGSRRGKGQLERTKRREGK